MVHPRNRIHELRKARGLTTRELAERIGRPQSTVTRLENSQQSLTLDLMILFARALGVRPSDLIRDDGDAPFGAMLGTLEGEGRLFDVHERHLIAVPYARVRVMRISDKAIVAVFEHPSRNRHYLTEERFPDDRDRDLPFIIAYEHGGTERVELRTYEIIGAVGGFSSKTGDPALRWIRGSETKISRIWAVIGEYRWLRAPDTPPMT